jgi:hypothetical protein
MSPRVKAFPSESPKYARSSVEIRGGKAYRGKRSPNLVPLGDFFPEADTTRIREQKRRARGNNNLLCFVCTMILHLPGMVTIGFSKDNSKTEIGKSRGAISS